MAQEVRLKVPEDVHIVISRRSKQAMDLRELVYSHLLLPLRANFGVETRFTWLSPEDWVKFCNGEEVRIAVQAGGNEALVDVHHGRDRVVYVKQVQVSGI